MFKMLAGFAMLAVMLVKNPELLSKRLNAKKKTKKLQPIWNK